MSTFYVGNRYNSRYGTNALRAINSQPVGSTQTQGAQTDSYNSKYKTTKKQNNDCKRVLTTAALMLGSAILAYKGKNVIQGAIKVCSQKTGEITSKAAAGFQKACPNMSESVKYFGKACKSPVNGIKNLGAKIAGLFKKAK